MTPKQKKAISLRMKKYWAKRNKAPEVAPEFKQLVPNTEERSVAIEDMSYNIGNAVNAILLGHLDAAVNFINREIERKTKNA